MIKNLVDSVRYGCAALLVVIAAFVLLEPTISQGATTASSQFTISQTVTSEVAFVTPPSNVILSPSLGGLTGGTSNGGTQLVVTTNDHLGYSMTLTASSSVGMIGNLNSSNSIPALVPSSGTTPDFAFSSVAANKAYFAYTVEASTTSDVSSLFKDNGTTCNTGALDTANSCWLNASSSAVTIINRSSQTTNSGATTTLKFRVVMSANPSPTIPDDTYVATTTVTATAN